MYTDTPAAHPLSYFTKNPFLRDDGADLCADCRTLSSRAESAKRYKIRAVVQPAGRLAGYPILDVLYYVSRRDEADATQVKWKSILVQTGRGRYQEIFHLQAFHTTISIERSRIVRSGGERVLATMDSDGGNGGGCWEGYWWFDRSGPHRVDLSQLRTAISSRLPPGSRFNGTCSEVDFAERVVRSRVQAANARCRACDYLGELTAHFRLNGAEVEAIDINFTPGSP